VSTDYWDKDGVKHTPRDKDGVKHTPTWDMKCPLKTLGYFD
jgi:hypothetical protein